MGIDVELQRDEKMKPIVQLLISSIVLSIYAVKAFGHFQDKLYQNFFY